METLFSRPLFIFDPLNTFIVLAIGLFSALVFLYSFSFMKGRSQLVQYYLYLILTALAAGGVVLSNNLILLLVCWGFLGLTLYLLINMGDEGSAAAAKKALIIVGGSDALMLLGIGIIYYFSGTARINAIRLELNSPALIMAYLCIAVACFAKAGAMPFHSWIPDCAKSAPVPVTAYLPASLDKLLGIYLLARISLNMFVMNNAMNTFLMLVGAITIIAAVMMALVQHNIKRLLGYHAVSQVGYMIIGLGTGNVIGIAGGLFHMLNHAVYKACLFLSAGNVEARAKTSDIDDLGGLAKFMPVTYICFLIASFSISGVPPFNGFVSKWLIYQGLILRIADTKGGLAAVPAVFCLIAALVGSGLTLASFIKLLHAVFLGPRLNRAQTEGIKEVSWLMWLPIVILASTCVVFGVFAFSLPLKYFIFPAAAKYQPLGQPDLLGAWSPVLATSLVAAGLILGFLVFILGRLKLSLRQDSAFVGGEIIQIKDENAVTGVDFYNTIKEMRLLRGIYAKAEGGVFDLYEQSKRIFSFSRGLQFLHNGVLPSYLAWVVLGMIGLFLALAR